VILLDVVMPDRTAFRFARTSRERGVQHDPVILVTSKDTASDKYWASSKARMIRHEAFSGKICYARCGVCMSF